MNSDFEFDIEDIDFSSESFSDQLEKIKSNFIDSNFWSNVDPDWLSLYDTISEVLGSGGGLPRGEFHRIDLEREDKPRNPWHYDTVAREGNLTEEALLDRQRKLFSMLDSIEFPRAEFVEVEALNYQSHKSHDDDFKKALCEYKEQIRLKEEMLEDRRLYKERVRQKERNEKQAIFNKCRAKLDEAEKVESEITRRREELCSKINWCEFGTAVLILTTISGMLSGWLFFLLISAVSLFGIIYIQCLKQKYIILLPKYPEET